jgi:hypothetical protein
VFREVQVAVNLSELAFDLGLEHELDHLPDLVPVTIVIRYGNASLIGLVRGGHRITYRGVCREKSTAAPRLC